MASRYSVVRAAFATALAALLAAPVLAQPPERERGYVMGTGGLTATTINSSNFGASVGFNLTPDLLVTGDVGRLVDVVPTFTRDDLQALDRMLTEPGYSHLTRFKMPATYVMGGIRYKVPTDTMLRPYVSASAGMARLAPEPKFLVEGIDYTSALLKEIATDPLAQAQYDRMFKDTTRPLASVGGGLVLTVARHFTLDVGYRYSRVFVKTDFVQSPSSTNNYMDLPTSPHQHNRLDVHRVIVGAGYAF